jgi:hypothetical protein
MRLPILGSLLDFDWDDWDDWFEFEWLDEAGLALTVVARVGIAFFVFRDATRRPRLLFGIPAWLWAVIVLATGLWGALAYWLANCSGLLRDESGPPAPRQPSA